jgi:hypothetical protein
VRNQLHQAGRLLIHRLRGLCSFFNQRRVLLGHCVHCSHGPVYLLLLTESRISVVISLAALALLEARLRTSEATTVARELYVLWYALWGARQIVLRSD